MIDDQRSVQARSLWIEACRTKMIELDSRIAHEEATELAEALWNRTSVRALGAISIALRMTADRANVRLVCHER